MKKGKKKLLIITNIVAHYNLSFYSRVAEKISNEYDVTIIADWSSDSAVYIKDSGETIVKDIDLPFSISNRVFFRKGLIRAINEIAPDKVVIYGNPRDLSVWQALFYLKMKGIWVATYGMFHRIGGMTLSTRWAYRLFSHFSTLLLTYSRRGAVTLDTLGVSSSKIRVIGTAIDNSDEVEAVTDSEREQFIQENDLVGRYVVLQVVRLSAYKRPMFIIDAAKVMCEFNERLMFVLIGGGELHEDIKEKIEEFGLQKNVRLLGPCYDKSILSRWFSVAKISVVPTCIGLSAHHSLGFGVPVMTDDSVANQASEFDILCHGLNSIIYKEGSLVDFCDKLEMFLSDVAFQKNLSEGALNTIKYNSNFDTKVDNFSEAVL